MFSPGVVIRQCQSTFMDSGAVYAVEFLYLTKYQELATLSWENRRILGVLAKPYQRLQNGYYY